MKIVSYGFTDFGEEEFYFTVVPKFGGRLGKLQINIRLLLQEFEDDIVWEELA
tara:strand:+ start:231 stop:389 length:159 start_codon:yes stop_codon:yes gene_type:complete